MTTLLTYDAQGRMVSQRQYARGLAGFSDMERWFSRNFHIFGGEATTHYYDQQFGGDHTYSIVDYDARGLPNRIRMPGVVVAQQTRNVAGLVTKRRSETSGPMAYVESNWTYDKLGRVLDQHVQQSLQANPGPVTVARQELAYFGNDDVKTLRHHLGASNHQFTYSYDHRHQITGVVTDTAGYFDAVYDYGPAGRLAHVAQAQTAAPTGSELVQRDVDYIYDGTDPEQVTELRSVSTGQYFAKYQYDSAGNQTAREYRDNNEDWDFLYDGNNRLRRVTKYVSGNKVGSEEYWYLNGQRSHVLKRDAAGAKTELIWFIGDVQAHYNGVGTVTKIYSHLSLGMPVARLERTGATNTSLEYNYHGIANSTLAAVAQDGTINASFSYAPFGEVLEATGSGGAGAGAEVRRRFNDKYEDRLSGLSYYGFRYYDKMAAGWTQADPLYRIIPDNKRREPRRALLYTFSLNNASRYLDPDGRDTTTCTIGGQCTSVRSLTSEVEARYDADLSWIPAPQMINESGSVRETVGSVIAGVGDVISFIPVVGSVGDALRGREWASRSSRDRKWIARDRQGVGRRDLHATCGRPTMRSSWSAENGAC